MTPKPDIYLRPDIVDLMLGARARLEAVSQPKELYTDKDIPGLGKNYMLERSRLKAIDTYTFYLRYYALLGLRREVARLVTEKKTPAARRLLTTRTHQARWEHERHILTQELPQGDVRGNLELLLEYQRKIGADVQESKRKDDLRGARVIDDYTEAHTLAEDDPFVKQTWAETKALEAEVKKLLSALK